MSALARQLERFREQAPLWGEQAKAVRISVDKKDTDALDCGKEVEKLKDERVLIERAYADKVETLKVHLTREREKAKQASEQRNAELQRSLELEKETVQILSEEETKNRALRVTLERTVQQLNAVKSEMLQCQAAAEAKGIEFTHSQEPRVRQIQHRLEMAEEEIKQVRDQSMSTAKEMHGVQHDIKWQRVSVNKLEDFVRKLTDNSARYALDADHKKEAKRLLQACERLRRNRVGWDEESEEDGQQNWQTHTPSFQQGHGQQGAQYRDPSYGEHQAFGSPPPRPEEPEPSDAFSAEDGEVANANRFMHIGAAAAGNQAPVSAGRFMNGNGY